jgi:NADPH2:quinone reductase
VIYGSNYDFKDKVSDLTSGKGIDLAIDGLGEKTLLSTIGTLGRGGTVVAIGAASGPIPAIVPTVLTPLGLRLAGGSVFTYVADPAELRRRARDVVNAIRDGWLRLDHSTGYPLERAADAHADIENRRAKGKLYLKP